MERMEAAVLIFFSELLQSRALGSSGEGKKAQVLVLAMGDHLLDQLVLGINFLFGLAFDKRILSQGVLGIGQGRFQLHGRRTGLGRMGLIHDHSVVPALGCVYLLIDHRKLLQRSHNNANAGIDGVPQVLTVLVLSDGLYRSYGVVKTGDRLLELGVKNRTVRYDDHAGKHSIVLSVV